MNSGIKIVLLIFFVLTMSCTKEPMSQQGSKSGTEVELRFEAFDTRATTTLDDAVNRVRILIFGSEGSYDKGRRLCNNFAIPDGNGLVKPVIITTGVRDIYLIVNEPLAGDGTQLDKYKNIATVAAIEALELAYVGTKSTPPYTPSDIPMFIAHLSQNIYVNEKNQTSSDLERMMAKVTLNLNVTNSNFTADKQPIIKSITIKNLPLHSYLVSKPYSGNLTDSEVQVAKLTAKPAATYDYSYSNTFYVPEYILSDMDKGAYLEIKGYANGEAVTKETKWIVKLGDAMKGVPQYGNRYNITRNRHYIFTGNVKSYGEHDVDIKVNVSPWSNVTLTDENGGYIIYSSSSTLPESKQKIANNICFYRVVCQTNIGGWSVVVKDERGNIIGGSVSKEGEQTNFAAKTPTITDGIPQTQSLNVTIQPNYEEVERIVTLEMRHDLSGSRNFNEKRTYTQKYMKLVLVGDLRADYTANPVNPAQITANNRQSGILGGWDGTSFCYLLFKYSSVVAIRSYFETYPARSTDAFGLDDIAWEPVNKTYPQIERWVMSGNSYSSGDIPWQTASYSHTLGDVKQGLGDPCRLVGLTPAQIRAGEIDNRAWQTPNTFTVNAIEGSFNANTQLAGLAFTGGMFLQGSGSRSYLNGNNASQGTAGHYRLTQAPTPLSEQSSNFDVHAILNNGAPGAQVIPHHRGDGFSVRCVKQ